MDESVEKERAEVPEPSPVTMDGTRYEAVPWGRARGLKQNGGYIAAVSEATGRELWLLKVYDVEYDDEMEDDKQDVFISEMAPDRFGLLRVTDERGRVYRIDVRNRAVMPT